MANSNIINAVFGSGICAVTTSAFRANYGMVLRFSGIDLPTAFEVDFSNYDVMGRDSITAIGQNNEVQIPDDLWDSGLNIYAYVYLHPTDDSGVTVYTVTIPVLGRPNRTEEEPTPHEQTVIEQAISALNDAVEQTAADVAAADASASAAAQSEANASASERSAAASASAALASQNAAESAAQSATESASGAAESARNAVQSASQAAESATAAQASAEQAERSAQSISGDVERAERAAQTATEKVTEAESFAATASGKANEAAQSAQSAASAAQNAAASEQLAESHATDAEQAKLDAQDAKEAAEQAQAAAEQAAESVSGLSEQIEQNTADIADLVQSKAGALIDTASGSIATFYPDATVPTVKGLTVNVEPVQDLHGYDAPWPAGGGKNKIDGQNVFVASSVDKQYSIIVNPITLQAGTYTLSFTVGVTVTATRNRPLYVAGTTYKYSNTDYPSSGRWSWTFTLSEETTLQLKWWGHTLSADCTISDFMLEAGSTATAYAPYSNECPISGWDEVEVPRTGKNLLKPYAYTKTQNGITFEESTDGSVRIYGTAIASTWLNNSITGATMVFPVKAGTYRLSGNTVGNANGLNVYLVKMKGGTTAYDQGSGATVTIPEDDDVYLQVQVTSGKTIDATIYPQLELGSTATAYEPYAGNTYTIQLGQTVYGGTVDAVRGVLTVKWVLITSATFNPTVATIGTVKRVSWNLTNMGKADKTLRSSSLSNVASWLESYGSDTVHFYVDSGGSYLHVFVPVDYDVANIQSVIPLATPITVDLSPIEVAVITGQTNNIWADSGNVSVEYAADLKTYINQKIAAAVAALS